MALIISEDVSRIRQIESEMLKKVEDLETMNRAMVDRELAMVELKKELSELRGNK